MDSVWPMGIIPITAKELKDFQDKIERLAIYERQYSNMVTHALGLEDKLEAVKNWYEGLTKESWKLVKVSHCGLCDELEKILEAEI